MAKSDEFDKPRVDLSDDPVGLALSQPVVAVTKTEDIEPEDTWNWMDTEETVPKTNQTITETGTGDHVNLLHCDELHTNS